MCPPAQVSLSDCADVSGIQGIIPAYGASMGNKSGGVFQIAMQNPNGLRVGDVREGAECIDVMNEREIDLFGLSKTRLNASTEARHRLAIMIRMDG